MKRTWLLLVAALMLWQLSACTMDESDPGRVSVSGQATRLVVPDEVVWVVTLNSMDKNLQTAKKDNDDKLSAVLKAGRKIAADEKDIEAGQLSIDRQYDYNQRQGQRVFSHFSVRRTVKIRLRDLDRFEEALDRLVKAADVELWFSYEISNVEEIRREIQLEALDDARDKALGLAERAHRKLGPALSISEFSPQASPVPGVMEKSLTSSVADSRGGQATPEARKLLETVYVIYPLD